MENLYVLTKKAKNRNQEAVLSIIQKFSPKIKQSLYQTSQQEREDLEQDLILKMIEVIYRYSLESTPGFWEFQQMVES